jgi:hypothetical protein
MKKLLRVLKISFLFLAMTVFTQIGGIVWLISLYIRKRFELKWHKSTIVFLSLYIVVSTFIAPPLASLNNRVSLPLSGNLAPLTMVTYILNRQYVTPNLKAQIMEVANKMEGLYPRTQTHYLDANFPFFDGFPLIPHLSHNDGKKLDLAFYYLDAETQQRTNASPSLIGYGVFEQPTKSEVNYPKTCKAQGYWQYGVLGRIVPQWHVENYLLDEERTTTLLKLLANSKKTSKIFIEPHLKTRWNLTQYDKIRFHGCQAVRHDDHIHTQVK